MSKTLFKLDVLEYERWLLENVIAKVGYEVVVAQKLDGYVQFAVRKRVYVPKKEKNKDR